jgi:hypothetical protein
VGNVQRDRPHPCSKPGLKTKAACSAAVTDSSHFQATCSSLLQLLPIIFTSREASQQKATRYNPPMFLGRASPIFREGPSSLKSMLEPHVGNMIAHFTNGLNLRCDVAVFTNTSVSSVCPCRCRQLAADAAIGSSGVATAHSV